MRTVTRAGHLRFAPENHLTTAQVKSYFSKLTSSRRKQSQPNIDVSSQEPMDTEESSRPQQQHDDTDEDDEDDFDSLVHELERQELYELLAAAEEMVFVEQALDLALSGEPPTTRCKEPLQARSRARWISCESPYDRT